MATPAQWRSPLLWALAYLLFQMAATLIGTLHGYGYFIDELYYIACARRLDWGYVDHPPLAPAILRLDLALLGDSLLAIRLPSALAGALTVALTGFVTMRLGGGRFAVSLASVALFCATVPLALFGFFSMNSLELLLWTALVAVVLWMVDRNDPRLWVVFGLVSGLALENKHTVVVLAASLLFGLLLAEKRRLLFSPWLLAGGAIAFLLFLPNLLWQVDHGFPSLEFYRNAALLKNRPSPPLQILTTQILFMNPGVLPIWVAGLYFFWRRPALRFVTIAYVAMLVLLIVSQSSRPDRLAGLYPVLFAGGSVWLEARFTSARSRTWLLLPAVAGCLAFAPLAAPLLPPLMTERYLAALGLDMQAERGEGKRSQLPQLLADRFGWERLVDEVSSVYDSLPEEEKKRATIFAPSYGHAGAIELLGRGRLPPVISPHNSYYLWGKDSVGRLSQGITISLGYDGSDLKNIYTNVERVAIYDCEFCMPWRDHMGIYIARGPKLSLAETSSAWAAAKHFE